MKTLHPPAVVVATAAVPVRHGVAPYWMWDALWQTWSAAARTAQDAAHRGLTPES